MASFSPTFKINSLNFLDIKSRRSLDFTLREFDGQSIGNCSHRAKWFLRRRLEFQRNSLVYRWCLGRSECG
jgi:hypothetical protein